MEQANSNSKIKLQQIDIFKRYASTLHKNDEGNDESELILTYDDFIKLISHSKTLYSKFTDHSFNLNQIPSNTFGCIFLAVDETNKGYLTISDWFFFNNLLEHENYHIILMYEFFKKFDIEYLKGQRTSILSDKEDIVDKLIKPTNYSNKFLSFDDLLLNLSQFKKTINLLHKYVSDDYARNHKLFLNWNKLDFLKYYECYPFGRLSARPGENSFITLNSLITILQSDMKSYKMLNGFKQLSRRDSKNHNYVLNREQFMELVKYFFSHKVSVDIFDSVNLSNTSLLKSNNKAISYNVFKDLFYLFQNFDLLNQALLKYKVDNEFTEEDLNKRVITKRDFMKILNTQYDKVNNINEFSPSQINLLFSIVANSKKNNKLKIKRNELMRGNKRESIKNTTLNENNSFKVLENFNANYLNFLESFAQDTPFKRLYKVSNKLVEHLINDKKDTATMGSDLTIHDFLKILNPNYLNDVVHKLELKHIQKESLYINYYFYPIFHSLYNFGLGSIAGCIGATVVYPTDFIKTRMQAQRSVTKYQSSIDCLNKVIKKEGFRGLYSGLGFQLLGVAPEKAIKLTVNDYLRKQLIDKNGHLHKISEVISGASAGACQVMFTNPVEIVKIRLQVKSEYSNASDVNAFAVIKKLGLRGLYKGASACLLRDIPFSAIYFPTYAHIKKDLFSFDPSDKTKRNRLKTWELLVAGALAGMPAAFLTTPFDVIKTRLQVVPKANEISYLGVIHATKTIFKEESIKSFFKGSGARVLRSSPQFGFTLAAYELFKNVFPLPGIESNGNETHTFKDNIPSIASPVTNLISQSYPSYTNEIEKRNEFFDSSMHPYGSDYLSYYYKSCQIAKTFIDLDTSFSKFDYTVYSKFLEQLKRNNKD